MLSRARRDWTQTRASQSRTDDGRTRHAQTRSQCPGKCARLPGIFCDISPAQCLFARVFCPSSPPDPSFALFCHSSRPILRRMPPPLRGPRPLLPPRRTPKLFWCTNRSTFCGPLTPMPPYAFGAHYMYCPRVLLAIVVVSSSSSRWSKLRTRLHPRFCPATRASYSSRLRSLDNDQLLVIFQSLRTMYMVHTVCPERMLIPHVLWCNNGGGLIPPSSHAPRASSPAPYSTSPPASSSTRLSAQAAACCPSGWAPGES